MVHFFVGNQSAFTAWPLTAPFLFACAHGFDAFEWFPDKQPSGDGWSAAEFPALDREVAFKNARARSMAVSVHASLTSTLATAPGKENLEQDIILARDVGANLLNLHADLSRGVDAFVDDLRPVVRQLAQYNLALAIENTVVTPPQQMNALFARAADQGLLSVGAFGMCLDIGHANLCSATHDDYIQYLDLLDPNVPIIHLHLHENWGDKDAHLPVFKGPAGLDPAGIHALVKRLCQRGFAGSAILEQWPQPPDLLVVARQNFLQIVNEHLPSP